MIVWRVSASHGRPSPWSKRVDFTLSRWGAGLCVERPAVKDLGNHEALAGKASTVHAPLLCQL